MQEQVLLVEDDASFARSIADVLSDEGFIVASASAEAPPPTSEEDP
jgi:DNA-binding response OmpR family regulator